MTNIEPIDTSTDTVPLIDRIKEAIDDRQSDLELGLYWIQVGDDFGQRMLSLICFGGFYDIIVLTEKGSHIRYFGGRLVGFTDNDMTVDWPPAHNGEQITRRIPWNSISSLKRVG